MPGWGRFRELCTLRFGPVVRRTRLSELARLPFTSTVHDYAEIFNELLCHAHNLSASQKAELFVGGLPDHIKVDVELRDPNAFLTTTVPPATTTLTPSSSYTPLTLETVAAAV